MNDLAFVCDVDGTVTDGSMIYSAHGKHAKVFGPDDWCLLSEIAASMPVHFISADKKGFAITQRRIEEECQYPLDIVPSDGLRRWQHIQSLYPDKRIIYMGDGCKDWYPLAMASYSITTCDALEHVKRFAKFVTRNSGGRRAVAEACLHIISKFELPQPLWLPELTLG